MKIGIAFTIALICLFSFCCKQDIAFAGCEECEFAEVAGAGVNGFTVYGLFGVKGRSELNGGVIVEQGLNVTDGQLDVSSPAPVGLHVFSRSELNGGVNVEQGLTVSDGGFGVVGRSELNGGVNVEQGLTVSDGPLGVMHTSNGRMINVGATLELWSKRLNQPLVYFQ